MRSIKNNPVKKSDKELWIIIEDKVRNNNYIFLSHAKKRQKDRNISDLDVLNILENKPNRRRQRNKKKDSYIEGFVDWKYCIEGLDLDGDKIRIIISFEESSNLLIVTVIRLDN